VIVLEARQLAATIGGKKMKKNVLEMLVVSGLSSALSGYQREQDNSQVGALPDKVTGKDMPTQVVDEAFESRALNPSVQRRLPY
jgi:hypothetical protein